MTQYAILSSDGTFILSLLGPLNAGSIGVTAIDNSDPRYTAWLARQALASAPCHVQSTATPSLDGDYAIDDASQQRIIGIAAGIAARGRLPGGGTTFNYRDAGGMPHAFSSTDFLNFAAALEDYVYALQNGQTPTSPVVIA